MRARCSTAFLKKAENARGECHCNVRKSNAEVREKARGVGDTTFHWIWSMSLWICTTTHRRIRVSRFGGTREYSIEEAKGVGDTTFHWIWSMSLWICTTTHREIRVSRFGGTREYSREEARGACHFPVSLGYATFRWIRFSHIFAIHHIEKLKFLGILWYKFKVRFWFDLNVYRGIGVSRVRGFWGGSIFSGYCDRESSFTVIETVSMVSRSLFSVSAEKRPKTLGF